MGRARRARREGIREELASLRLFRVYQLQPGGCGLGSGAYLLLHDGAGNFGQSLFGLGPEATVNDYGVAVAMPQGYGQVPNPSTGTPGNVGTTRAHAAAAVLPGRLCADKRGAC